MRYHSVYVFPALILLRNAPNLENRALECYAAVFDHSDKCEMGSTPIHAESLFLLAQRLAMASDTCACKPQVANEPGSLRNKPIGGFYHSSCVTYKIVGKITTEHYLEFCDDLLTARDDLQSLERELLGFRGSFPIRIRSSP